MYNNISRFLIFLFKKINTANYLNLFQNYIMLFFKLLYIFFYIFIFELFMNA